MSETEVTASIFTIEADYKPNGRHPKYYVIARNKTAAKRKFSERIPWLKIYTIYDGASREEAEELMRLAALGKILMI